jgi:hypothetical protein
MSIIKCLLWCIFIFFLNACFKILLGFIVRELFIQGFIRNFCSIKVVNLRWWNRLFIKIFSSCYTDDLGYSLKLMSILWMIYKLFLSGSYILVNRSKINALNNLFSAWLKCCFSVCYSEEIFTFYLSNIPAVTRNPFLGAFFLLIII